MPAASMGWASRLSMGATGTAVGSFTEAIEIVSENLKKTGTILDTNGIRGTRSHASERTAAGTYAIGGQITLHPTPAVLDLLLPRILGANASGTTFALADTLPEFDVLVDRGAKRFVYGSCKIGKATFTGSAGQLIQLVLDIVGKTETVSATSFPSITAPTDSPYVFHQGALTLVSSARQFFDFEAVIDNVLATRFANSESATDISPTDRIVSLKATTPFTSDEVDLYNQALLGSAGSLAFTNGGRSVTFTYGKLQFPDNSPVVAGKEEIPLTLDGIARMTSTTRELVVTNDSTA